MAKIFRPVCLMVILALVLSLGIVILPASEVRAQPSLLYCDDMESGIAGWTATGFWHQIINAENIYVYNVGGATPDCPTAAPNDICPDLVTLPDMDGAGHAFLPAAYSGNTAWWFGVNENGTFIDTQADFLANIGSQGCKNGGGTFGASSHSGTLTSPVIDLTCEIGATLSFWTWWEIESVDAHTYDMMYVEISTDGTSWTTIGTLNPTTDVNGGEDEPYSSAGYNTTPAWVEQQFDLTPYVGSPIQVRFTFDTINGAYNGFRGWFIDDVCVISDGRVAPTAGFTATPTSGWVPLTVQFTDLSPDNVTSWLWLFGDGETSREQHPSHIYNIPGTYTVTLTVTGPCGTAVATDYIEVCVEPARIIVRNLLIQPANALPGQQVVISADVVNQGGVRGSKNIELVINGQAEQSTRVGVDPGSAQHITFFTSKSVPGTYEVYIEGQASTFNVLLRPQVTTTGADEGLGTGAIIAIVVIGVILLAGIVIVFIFIRR